MKKRINTNPRRGAKHWKAPSKMFWKSLRGMLPHKSPRGAAALGNLKVFEGIPFPYDHKKRMFIPDALRTLRLRARRNFCSLGELATLTGWTKGETVEKLEEKRKTKSAAFHTLKSKKADAKAKAATDKSVAPFNAALAKLGY